MLRAIATLIFILTANTAVATVASLDAINEAIEANYIDLDLNDGPGCAVGYARNGQ